MAIRALLRGFAWSLGALLGLGALYALVNELLAPALYALFARALSLGAAAAAILALTLVALALGVVAAADAWWRGVRVAARRRG